MVEAISGEACLFQEKTAESGSFERDTVTWAFAKLAEYVLDDVFREASERRRYATWLQQEAPLSSAAEATEQGLLLVDLDLGCDGGLQVIARPTEGEFVFTVRHQRFSVVLASAYAALASEPEQECICVAHFEGDAPLAARWASGLRHSLERRREAGNGQSTGACLH